MIFVDQITAKHVIFDLDGTLIDSAPAILASFAKAFAACERTPATTLVPSLIGPPLMQTLALLADTDDPSVLKPLAEAFKTHYDEVGFRDTTVFSGIDAMLADLIHRGCHLYLATNKRLIPTQKIMTYLGWEKHFMAIYTLDSFDPPLKSKAELLAFIIREKGLALSDTVYVGDRDEDREAALANNIDCLLVGWGYGGN